MNAIGGYFSLEIDGRPCLFPEAVALNASRFALQYILRARKYNKVYIPYLTCDSIFRPLQCEGVAYEFYRIDSRLEPELTQPMADDEALLYINYYGLKDDFIPTLCQRFRNVILDNTQAFYGPVPATEAGITCDAFNSCRKWFGVADGAYLFTDCRLDAVLPQDESFDRMTYLLKRIDRTPQEAYADFQANESHFEAVGMRQMSRLTAAMMNGFDLQAKAAQRRQNYMSLDRVLHASNRLPLRLTDTAVPFVYPYYVEDGAELRQWLIDHQVFCARYWPNVLAWCDASSIESQLATNVVCIPIDQRYGEAEMQHILSLIEAWSQIKKH